MRSTECRNSALAARLAALGLLAGLLAGCNPWRDQVRPDGLIGRIGGNPVGQIIEPKKCALRVAILERPLGDPALNEALWRAVDEQSIAPAARAALQANGLRMGRITGDIPTELEAVLDAPPPNKVEPVSFHLDEAEQTLVSVCEPAEQITILLNRDGRVFGKDFDDAGGFFRVTPQHHDGAAVSLRLTPEIHYGPIQRSFQAIQQPNNFAPQQFKINDGQREEILRDLTAELVLEPGQVAVIGCMPDRERSLGSFFLTLADAQADKRRQRLVLIWASRNQLGVVGDKDKDKAGTGELPPVIESAGDRAREAAKPEMAAAVDEVRK